MSFAELIIRASILAKGSLSKSITQLIFIRSSKHDQTESHPNLLSVTCARLHSSAFSEIIFSTSQ